MTSLRRFKLLACAVLIPLVGCGGKPDPVERPAGAAKHPPLEACKLLLYEEADPGHLDGLVPAKTEIHNSVGDDFAKCMYSTVELPPSTVALELRRFATAKKAAGAQSSTVDYMPRLAAAEVEPVPGVGDEAAWASGRLNQLHARAGDLRLIVTVEVGEPESRRDRAAAIARLAIARLAAAERTTDAPASAAPGPGAQGPAPPPG